MTTPEPRTAAGRAEHDRQHRHCKTFCSDGDKYGEACPVRERILAIEREAALPAEPAGAGLREALARLTERVEAMRLMPTDFATRYGHGYADALSAFRSMLADERAALAAPDPLLHSTQEFARNPLAAPTPPPVLLKMSPFEETGARLRNDQWDAQKEPAASGSDAAPPPPPLDVERLARALLEVHPGHYDYWPTTENEGVPYHLNCRYEAKKIAAAYDAARVTSEEDES